MNIRDLFRGAITKIASLFDFKKIYRKIHELFLNCFVAKKDEYYSYNEPTPKQMKNKTFWIQIVDEEDR